MSTLALRRSDESVTRFWRCLREFHSNGSFCDLRLLCGGDGEVIECHRLVLAAVSPAIARCLRSCPPPELVSEDFSSIQLPDLSGPEVRKFVHRVYSSLAEGEDVDFDNSSGVLTVLGVGRGPDLGKVAESGQEENVWTFAKGERQQVIEAKIEPADVAYYDDYEEDDHEENGDDDFIDDDANGEEEEEEDEEEDESYNEAEESDEDYQPLREKKPKKKNYRKRNYDNAYELDDPDYFAEVPPPSKKKKKKNKGKKKYKRKGSKMSYVNAYKKPLDEDTSQLVEKVANKDGTFKVEMLSRPFDSTLDCSLSVRKESQFMCLLGIRPKTTERDVMSAIPLAWTYVNEEEERDELERVKRNRPTRPFAKAESGADDIFMAQYEDYCTAVQTVFGLSDLEVGYQDLVFDRMEMGSYCLKGIKNRYSLMREFASKPPDEISSLLNKQQNDAAARIVSKNPFVLGDEVRDSFEATLELSASLSLTDLKGVCFITVSSNCGIRAQCLDVNTDLREQQVRGFVSTLFDVWSLRSMDMNYIDKCFGIIRRYEDMSQTGDVITACRKLLSDGDGSLRKLVLSKSPVSCPRCGEQLATKSLDDLLKYDAHLSCHTFAESVLCDCPDVTEDSSPEDRRVHAETNHLSGFDRCQYCEFFAAPGAMEKHVAKEHRIMDCVDCGEHQSGTEGLKIHAALHHPGRHSIIREAARRKGKNHPKNEDDEDKEEVEDVKEMENEAGKVVETCHVCGKEFDKHSNFQIHMRIHNTYTCDKCGIVIQGYNIMRNHKRKAHPDPNKTKGYPCEVCGKLMSSQMRLREHILRIHAPDHERPHLCPDCGRGFARKGELEAHRNVVHIKNRPYACRFGCGEAFNHYATRGDHEKSKHGMRFPKSKAQDQIEKIFRKK